MKQVFSLNKKSSTNIPLACSLVKEQETRDNFCTKMLKKCFKKHKDTEPSAKEKDTIL